MHTLRRQIEFIDTALPLYISCFNVDPARRVQLIKRRAVAKASLTRLQNFIEAGDQKINAIQVGFNKLSDIFNKYDSAQDELECLDEPDYTLDREEFENQYYQVEAKLNELLHPVIESPLSRYSSLRSRMSGRSNNSPRSHVSSAHIKLSAFECDTCSWLHYRETFEALIVNNTALSNVQKFHYLIALLKNDAKDLVSNLQITNENFLVAWQLVTQRYNNKQLIAMMHAQHLCHLPQVRKGDTSPLRQLINHVSSHMNALQALSLNVPVQDLMLKHLMLVTIDPETQ